MDNVTVIDNFLTKKYFDRVQKTFLSNNLDWYYRHDITSPNSDKNFNFGFNHWIIDPNKSLCRHGEFMLPFFFQTMELNSNLTTVLRSRADMTVSQNTTIKYSPHIDLDQIHFSSIFYLNDTDGDTIIYNEQTTNSNNIPDKLTIKEVINPVPNRLVLFYGNLIHTGHSPIKNNRRVIINTNFN